MVRTVLGLDPGLATTGYGIVETDSNLSDVELLNCGAIKTPPEMSFDDRLDAIYSSVFSLTQEFTPDHVIVEELFFNENVKTAIDVGQARGVVLLSLQHYRNDHEGDVTVEEVNPLTVKKTLTGNGYSDKKSVQMVVQQELSLDEAPQPDDTADALAAAIGAIIRERFPDEFEELS